MRRQMASFRRSEVNYKVTMSVRQVHSLFANFVICRKNIVVLVKTNG